jgi:hypothetical protein
MGPIGTWTAISRPPHLTALALWPNMGTWGGGGLFESEHSILLNQEAGVPDLPDGFELPSNMKVQSLRYSLSLDEYDSTYHTQLLRDGWTLRQKGARSEYRTKSGLSWRFDPARVYEKRMSRKKSTQCLQLQLRGVAEVQERWYTLDYELFSETGASLLKLPRAGWADWDSNGDLLFADGGKLFRLPWSSQREDGREAAVELADFTSLTFVAKEAPEKARQWR